MTTPGLNEPGLGGPGAGGTAVLEPDADVRPQEQPANGDHERFSHYAPKDKVTEAIILGTPVTALCGKVWVPSRDPERFPTCPECQEIWETLARDE